MAISVGRVQRQNEGTEQGLRYATRMTALAAYAAAVAVAYVLLAPLLWSDGAAGTATVAPPPEPRLITVQQGDTLAGVAARNGISVARLLALNPDLQPLGLEPRQRLRIT
jgi:LysM repeat protein